MTAPLKKEADIRRKLQACGLTKPEQYQQIIVNLLGQKDRLQGDLFNLQSKVKLLKQKQARKFMNRTSKPTKVSSLKKISIQKRSFSRPIKYTQNVPTKSEYRQLLLKKYEQLRRLQAKAKKTANNNALLNQYRQFLNKLFAVQQQLQFSLRQLHDEQSTYKKLKKALKKLQADEKHEGMAQQLITKENYLIRKKITTMQRMVDKQLGKQIQLHNCMIDFREREREVRSRARQLRSIRRQPTPEQPLKRWQTLQQQQPAQPSEYSQVSSASEQLSVELQWRQINSEQQIFQLQGQMNRWLGKIDNDYRKIDQRILRSYPNEALSQRREGSKLTFGKQLDILLAKCKKNIGNLTQLFQKKVSFLLQLETAKKQNHISELSTFRIALQTVKVTKQHQVEPQKDKVMYPRTYHEQQSQTEQYRDPSPLRRQIIGTLAQNMVSDRLWLKDNKETTIKSIHIYHTDRGIASLRTQYIMHTDGASKFSKIALPQSFVAHYCKVHTVSCGPDDFLKYFKLRYRPKQGKITSVRVVSNRNIKGGWGQTKEKDDSQEKQLVLDISEDEYPVCVMLSHTQRGPYWYLSGFGLEINDL